MSLVNLIKELKTLNLYAEARAQPHSVWMELTFISDTCLQHLRERREALSVSSFIIG
jgi:hypothetical protein